MRKHTGADEYEFVPRRRPRVRKTWIPVLCLLVVFGALLFLFFLEENAREDDIPLGSYVQTSEIKPFPGIAEEVLLCSEAAKQCYDNEIDVYTAIKLGEPYRPLAFEYDMDAATGRFIVSEDMSFVNTAEYDLKSHKSVFRIDNLKTGTEYFYKAIIEGEEYSGSFRTRESTRFISIPGTENVRDIGGYTTLDGKRVRQGLLIRGAELDGLENPSYKVSEETIDKLQRELGIVYDMDLRSSEIYTGEYVSPFGADVAHAFYTSPDYKNLFESYLYPNVRRIFEDLAKPENYPMYLHCTWGKDRTGCIVYLLQGVLNMSEADMEREYMLSGYIHTDIREQDKFHLLADCLEPYDGDTVQEKIVSYLTGAVGVTEQQLQSIRDIFLEG